MLEAITFGALILCANVFLRASCELEKPTISRDLIISITNSSTVPFNGNLYTVSINQAKIHINSTDSSHKECDIAIDPAKDNIQGHVEVTSTKDELFIVGVRSVKTTEIDEYTSNSQFEYTVLRVDPKTCSYKSVSIPEINDDNSGDYYFPRIVKHQTGTDVFYRNLKNCAPCRVDNEGLRSSESTPQIQPENTTPVSSRVEKYNVQYVDPINVYFYVYDSHDYANSVQITKLKLLDSNDFKTLKEKSVDFRIAAVSKQKDSIGHLGVCTKSIDKFLADATFYTDFQCHGLSADLDIKSTYIWSPADTRSEPISDISYEFDKEGNSYISFAERSNLRLNIVDKDGKLLKALDMGEIDSRFKKYPPHSGFGFSEYSYWNVNGFLVGDQYCIVTKQSPSYYSVPLEQVKCVDVQKYVKQ